MVGASVGVTSVLLVISVETVVEGTTVFSYDLDSADPESNLVSHLHLDSFLLPDCFRLFRLGLGRSTLLFSKDSPELEESISSTNTPRRLMRGM